MQLFSDIGQLELEDLFGEQTRGFIGERVTTTFLRPQIDVNLIDCSKAYFFSLSSKSLGEI